MSDQMSWIAAEDVEVIAVIEMVLGGAHGIGLRLAHGEGGRGVFELGTEGANASSLILKGHGFIRATKEGNMPGFSP
jgi:alanine dehydrogenase